MKRLWISDCKPWQRWLIIETFSTWGMISYHQPIQCLPHFHTICSLNVYIKPNLKPSHHMHQNSNHYMNMKPHPNPCIKKKIINLLSLRVVKPKQIHAPTHSKIYLYLNKHKYVYPHEKKDSIESVWIRTWTQRFRHGFGKTIKERKWPWWTVWLSQPCLLTGKNSRYQCTLITEQIQLLTMQHHFVRDCSPTKSWNVSRVDEWTCWRHRWCIL